MKKAKNQNVIASPAYPEVLPWFARRAKISESRAKALWDLTCAELNGQNDTPAELAKARMAQFIERVGQEAGLPITPDYTEQPNGFGWLYRHYGRMTDMALVSGGAIVKFWQQAMTPPQMAR
jgi:hypothetical protein